MADMKGWWDAMESLPEWLSELRDRSALTLAERTGIHRVVISKVLMRRGTVTLDSYARVAKLAGCTIGQLIDWHQEGLPADLRAGGE